MTTVIHIRHAPRGWRENPRFVYIGRANRKNGLARSKWANPYHVYEHGRGGACRRYREEFPKRTLLVRFLPELVDKVLVCYCKPDTCHGDFLAEQANALAA